MLGQHDLPDLGAIRGEHVNPVVAITTAARSGPHVAVDVAADDEPGLMSANTLPFTGHPEDMSNAWIVGGRDPESTT